jgi:hypothetical protein
MFFPAFLMGLLIATAEVFQGMLRVRLPNMNIRWLR